MPTKKPPIFSTAAAPWKKSRASRSANGRTRVSSTMCSGKSAFTASSMIPAAERIDRGRRASATKQPGTVIEAKRKPNRRICYGDRTIPRRHDDLFLAVSIQRSSGRHARRRRYPRAQRLGVESGASSHDRQTHQRDYERARKRAHLRRRVSRLRARERRRRQDLGSARQRHDREQRLLAGGKASERPGAG